MLAFISYPREYEEYANTLVAGLEDRGIKTFLDKEDIRQGDVFTREIRNNIEKADIFIVLYLPSAVTESRYFSIELTRIKEVVQTNFKKVIPVIFPPTKVKDLSPFYRIYQLIEANGDETDYWIEPIVTEIERLKKIKKRKLRTKTIFGIATLAMLALFMSFYNPPINGKSECNSLIGNYKLDQEYTFSTENTAKSIANTNSTWKAKKCEYKEENDTYILLGSKYTEFDIEIPIKDKNIRIATVSIKYPSKVIINNKDGKLIHRYFDISTEPTNINKYPTGKDKKGSKLDDSLIDEMIGGVLDFRNDKHSFLKTKGCSVAKGEKEYQLTLAFICHDYTRVMTRIPDNLES